MFDVKDRNLRLFLMNFYIEVVSIYFGVIWCRVRIGYSECWLMGDWEMDEIIKGRL